MSVYEVPLAQAATGFMAESHARTCNLWFKPYKIHSNRAESLLEVPEFEVQRAKSQRSSGKAETSLH